MKKLQKKAEGYWFYPVTDFVYDKSYIDKYKTYAITPMGNKILKARLDILKQYTNLLDIGIGSGNLIKNKPNSKGFDVNPEAIKELKTNNMWCNIYKDNLDEFDAISFFDSFEHIEFPELILNRITNQHIIIAIPIFKNFEDLINSKHFRKDEHFHYFTLFGFLYYMEELGFYCKEILDIEIKLGRESIYTFIFKGLEYENN